MAKVFRFDDLRFRYRNGVHDEQVSVNGKLVPDCVHRRITLDENGQTITCDECGKELSAWWTLMATLRRYDSAEEHLRELAATVLRDGSGPIESPAAPEAPRAPNGRPRAQESESSAKRTGFQTEPPR